MPQFVAGFEGLSHALPALAVFWLLISASGMRSSFAIPAEAAISIAFAFNGLALAIVSYPHFEMLIPGLSVCLASNPSTVPIGISTRRSTDGQAVRGSPGAP
jgi:hypothetical protein